MPDSCKRARTASACARPCAAALGDSELDLTELSQAVIVRAGNDPMLRYQLLPPDIVDRDEFVGFWKPDAHSNTRRAAENKAKRRLQFDVDLEFGLQSRTGRTLELTGSVAAEVYLGAPHRAAIIGRRAVDKAGPTQLPLTGSTDHALARWVRGTVERYAPAAASTTSGCARTSRRTPTATTSGAADRAARACPPSRKAVQHRPFPALKSGTGSLPEGFDPITAASSWYARWTSRCLDVSPLGRDLPGQGAVRRTHRTDGAEHHHHRDRFHGVRIAADRNSSERADSSKRCSMQRHLAHVRRVPDAGAGQRHHRRRTRRRARACSPAARVACTAPRRPTTSIVGSTTRRR